MTDSWDDVGAIVKQRRQALRLSLRDIAPLAGVSVSTWHSLENGNRVAEQSRVKIAQALRWPDDAIDRLLDGIDPGDFDDRDMPSTWEAELAHAVRNLTDAVRDLQEDLRAKRSEDSCPESG